MSQNHLSLLMKISGLNREKTLEIFCLIFWVKRLARVWLDPNFHKEFSQDPQKTLESNGVFLPENMSLEFQKQNTDRPRILFLSKSQAQNLNFEFLFTTCHDGRTVDEILYFLLPINNFLLRVLFAQVTNSDRLFKMATDFVKEKKYTDAVSIFEELARNNEYDAQYNLAFLINGGKGTTKNYSEALFWAYLSKLGKIEKAEELSKDLAKLVPEKVLKDVREKVLQALIR